MNPQYNECIFPVPWHLLGFTHVLEVPCVLLFTKIEVTTGG